MVKVSVTVKDHKITAIKVLSNSDDAAFFNRASAGVIKNILAKQSLKVDVVSGATYSSKQRLINRLVTAVLHLRQRIQRRKIQQRKYQEHTKMVFTKELEQDSEERSLSVFVSRRARS